MEIPVANIYSNPAGFDAIAKIAAYAEGLSGQIIKLDYSNCSFFEANMCAALFVAITRLRENLNTVKIVGIKQEIKDCLLKNHFLKVLNMKAHSDQYGTAIPFKKFKTNAEEHFLDYINRHLAKNKLPTMTDAVHKGLLKNILEIFTNSSSHSLSHSGIFVCGQLFPSLKRLEFTIADAGVGILNNVRRFTQKKDLDSRAAIQWALIEGNTTRVAKQPGGLGLKLIKDFIKFNQGKFQIVSNFACYELHAEKQSFTDLKHNFPGTCVNIEINTGDEKSYRLKSES